MPCQKPLASTPPRQKKAKTTTRQVIHGQHQHTIKQDLVHNDRRNVSTSGKVAHNFPPLLPTFSQGGTLRAVQLFRRLAGVM